MLLENIPSTEILCIIHSVCEEYNTGLWSSDGLMGNQFSFLFTLYLLILYKYLSLITVHWLVFYTITVCAVHLLPLFILLLPVFDFHLFLFLFSSNYASFWLSLVFTEWNSLTAGDLFSLAASFFVGPLIN